MEASALHAPAPVGRLTVTLPLLRLRSDEQLVACFRAGSEDAFRVLHDRYRQRLFAYVRQMLSVASRQDAEDVLQDVFVRAYGALRADEREINVRAWLYRVAHNRCIDHLRRPAPAPVDVLEASRKPLHDPLEEAERREDLRRLVADVARLPAQQRSALLMREIDGLSYQDLAAALDVTLPAVKSLLVRARVGLVEAAEARDTACCEIRGDLMAAYDRGVKASGRARRHMRECSGCREYRTALRGVRRSFAALLPGGFAPMALVAKAIGVGGAGGGAAAGSAVTAGGGSAAGTVLAGATACKVAAVVCTAAITAGGAVEVSRFAGEGDRRPEPRERAAAAPAAPRAQAPGHAAPPVTLLRRPAAAVGAAAPGRAAPAARRPAGAPARDRARDVAGAPREAAPLVAPLAEPHDAAADPVLPTEDAFDGGVMAPEEPPAQTPVTAGPPAPGTGADPAPGAGAGSGAPTPAAPPAAPAASPGGGAGPDARPAAPGPAHGATAGAAPAPPTGEPAPSFAAPGGPAAP